MALKLKNYAFVEGVRGYRNGCASYQNPYYNDEGNVDPCNQNAFDQWAKGWGEAAAQEAEARST
jgi:hypothetical protein